MYHRVKWLVYALLAELQANDTSKQFADPLGDEEPGFPTPGTGLQIFQINPSSLH
ncbi:hypothetical protein [Pleomorphomonas oryzae]|uniref:hypothetical protein n=1 Tax=Pleomorphomonas oryzae TaxID=261934 RepID=UPI0004155995|nr:hypothetical protein [Pleomorphomonas oryzae]